MIEEDYVNFETAKLLKEKGFDPDECEVHYDPYNHQEYEITLQMAMKWIRKKGFHIFAPLEIDYDENDSGTKWYYNAVYYPEIRRVSDGKIMYDNSMVYAEPEQAYEVAIKYCLENLI